MNTLYRYGRPIYSSVQVWKQKYPHGYSPTLTLSDVLSTYPEKPANIELYSRFMNRRSRNKY